PGDVRAASSTAERRQGRQLWWDIDWTVVAVEDQPDPGEGVRLNAGYPGPAVPVCPEYGGLLTWEPAA
ncbi:MAG TPA: hypothetical protein VF635_14135, partial [Propionibacteriaceae bacterium]